MRKMAVLVACAVIQVSALPALAAECTSSKGIDASCTRKPTIQSQLAKAEDKAKSCRDTTASFTQSVMLRRAAASRVDGRWVLAALDSVIDAFNVLVAVECGG